MKAIVIDRYGGREELEMRDVPKPSLRPGDVLIEVHAASVNPEDWKIRSGLFRELVHYRFPLILGWDVAGIVVETGPEVEDFHPGDQVFSRTDITRNGTYAEYVAVNERYVARKPDQFTFEESASVPLVGLTAWQALVDFAAIRPGQKVLVHGGAGGVGSFAVQLAKVGGCFVAATCSSANVDFVKSLGADQAVDYTKGDFWLELHDYDVVLDTVGGEVYRRSFGVLKPQQGTMISILEQPDHDLADRTGVRTGYLFMRSNGTELARIGQLLDQGAIRPVIREVLPLSEVRRAHELSESGHGRGKIVLKIR